MVNVCIRFSGYDNKEILDMVERAEPEFRTRTWDDTKVQTLAKSIWQNIKV